MFLLLLLLLLPSSPGRADTPKINKNRAIFIDTELTPQVLTGYASSLASKAATSSDPIDIVIDSPGGDVIAGYMLIDIMEDIKSRGVQLNCYVRRRAQSLAFSILLHCNSRYALPGAIFLWHGAQTFLPGRPVNEEIITKLYVEVSSLNKMMFDDIQIGLSISKDEVRKHALLETTHTTASLTELSPGFITIVPAVEGIMPAVTPPATRKESTNVSTGK